MKKIIVVLILTIVIIVAVSVVSFGEEAGDITVFGIILGKSLKAAGLRECRRSRYSTPDLISYDEDKSCYEKAEKGTGFCVTKVITDLSFPMDVYVSLLNECDRQSPVQEIEARFSSENHEKVLLLMINKFGRPKKTETSVVQNRMGATLEKIRSFWNIRGHSMYLTNITNLIDTGVLRITHSDKVRRDAEKSRKHEKSDREKF